MSQMTEQEKAQLAAEAEKVTKEFTARGHHDICLKVLGLLLDEDGVSWRETWTPELAQVWWGLMDEARAQKTHRKALDDQLMLSAYLHQRMDKLNLAGGLLLLINECVLRWQLVDFDSAALNDQAGKIAAATGGKARAVPAKVGEKAPEGALRPDQFGVIRRI